MLLLTFCLRAMVAAFWPSDVNNDEWGYVRLAANMARYEGFVEGGMPEVRISPMFPTLHAFLILATGQPLFSGKLLGLLGSSLIPVLFFLLLIHLCGERPARWAALFVALHFALVATAADVQPEALTGAFLFWFLLLWARKERVMASVVLSFACVTRPEVILLVPVWGIWELWFLKENWRKIAVCLIIIMVFTAPFLFYLKSVTGRFCLSGKDRWVYVLGVTQYRWFGEPMPIDKVREVEADTISAARHLQDHPGEAVSGYFFRWGLLLRNLFHLTGWYLVPFVILGWIALGGAPKKERWILLFPLFLLPVLPLGFTLKRHLLPILPVFVALAGIGAETVWQWIAAAVQKS